MIGESTYRRTNGIDKITTATASTRYPLAVPVITSASSARPTSRPSACGPKIAPEMIPRWVTGTWSATAANSPADAIEKPSEANIQQTITPTQDCWGPIATSERASTTTPAAIHTRRRPNRVLVRSHSAPATGSAISATTPAAPLAMPKSRTLCAASSAANWFGSTSWTGTSHAIQNPNHSSVNRPVQPRDTRTVGSAVVSARGMLRMYRSATTTTHKIKSICPNGRWFPHIPTGLTAQERRDARENAPKLGRCSAAG